MKLLKTIKQDHRRRQNENKTNSKQNPTILSGISDLVSTDLPRLITGIKYNLKKKTEQNVHE